MKAIVVGLLLCLLITYQASAQVFVDGVNINDQTITYCQLIGINRTSLTGTRIWVDYGQPKFAANSFNLQVISGEERKAIKFNSVVDALNFMARNGWELVTANITSSDDDPITYVYLLRKRLL